MTHWNTYNTGFCQKSNKKQSPYKLIERVARAKITKEKIVTKDDDALEFKTSEHVAFIYPPPPSETQDPILNGAWFTENFPAHVVDDSYLISDAEDPEQVVL